MLRFNPTTGVSVDDISVVREVVREDWRRAFQKDGDPPLDVDPETPAGQLIDSQTAHIVEKDNEILFLSQQFNPLSAEGVFQDALGKIYFLNRKREQASVAVCTCTGLEGTAIPAGAAIRSSVDGTRWLCQEGVTIPAGGEVSAVFVAEKTGPLAAAAHTLTEIVTIVPGWDAVTNAAAAVTGRDVESQMEFEQRRYNSVAVNARGSLSALYAAVAATSGVIDAVVLENQGSEMIWRWGIAIPGHSVCVSVIGGDDEDIAEAIYRKKDAGCGTCGNHDVVYTDSVQPGQPEYTYSIERPEPLPVRFRVVIRHSPATPGTVDTLVREAIVAEFEGRGLHGTPRVGMCQSVYAARFYCAVVEAAKIAALDTIYIAAGTGDYGDHIDIMATQAPVLDPEDIHVEII